MNIIEVIKSKRNFIGLTGASKQDIQDAENALGVQFAEDYVEYLSEFGAASFEGHELTGICSSKRLDVVSATMHERDIHPDIFIDWYVIEQTNMDGIVIWQDGAGTVYQTTDGAHPVRLCATLLEYIDL